MIKVHLDTSAIILTPVDGLIAVGNVEEEIFFVVFLVKRSHGGAGWWNHVVDEEEEGVLGSKVDPFSNEEIELADGQVGRYQIFLFVQVSDPRLRRLFHDHRYAVRVLLPDLLSFRSPLFERMLFLVLPLHLSR